VACSLATVLPVAIFFRTAELSRARTEQCEFTGAVYLKHLSDIVTFLGTYEFLYVALLVTALMYVSRFLAGKTAAGEKERPLVRLSDYVKLYLVLNVLLTARLPFYVLFERYFFYLQPLVVMMLLLDGAVAMKSIARLPSPRQRRWVRIAGIVPGIFLCAVCVGNKLESLEGHFYELTHRYSGPLDYAIPFIEKNYPRPQDLVIATNYEENAFMYYLGAKVTIGFVGKELASDMAIRPDIIVYRKGWENFVPQFMQLLQGGSYARVTFPVADYPVNNIPELRADSPVHHRYRTELTDDEKRMLDMFVTRKGNT
jgi:hypothetical protein